MTTAEQHSLSVRTKHTVAAALNIVEDVVYIGLGILLAAAAIWLLFDSAWIFVHDLLAHALAGQIITLLDQILLILLVVELLYTVQVSFREHTLVAEPFLVVALIATIRKILVLTAQISKLPEESDIAFMHFIIELGTLSLMVLVLVGSLIFLQRHAKTASDGSK